MHKHITRIVTTSTLIMLSLIAHDTHAQPQPPRLLVQESRCSDPDPNGLVPDEVFVSIERQESDGFVRIPPPLVYRIPNEDHRCNVTFTFEAATSESNPQLLVLAYAERIEEEAGPLIATFRPGPVLTEIRSGLDETHTFISVIDFPGSSTTAVRTRSLTPCVQSAFGGQSRLGRRCLLVECYISGPR
jgi:hypothetical protein